MPWFHIVFDLGIFNLKKKGPLLRLWIKLLCDAISGPSNFDRFFEIDFALMRLRLGRGILSFTSSSFSQIGLMTLALSMGQIITLIVMEC